MIRTPFNRSRLRLTAYYVAVLAVILLAFDIGVVAMLNRSLETNLDDELQRKAQQAATAILDLGGTTFFDRSSLASDPSWADVSLFATTTSGSVIQTANPLSLSVLPDRASLEQAMGGRSAFSRANRGRESYVVYTQPVYRRDLATVRGPDVIAVVQVARSTRTLAYALTQVITLVLAATAVALLLAFIAGLWLAERALQPIQQSLIRQTEFVRDASHELRTPTTVIRTAAESILRQKAQVSSKVATLAEDIVTESRQLGSLVDDLGLLAQADARASLRREPLMAEGLMAEIARSGSALARSRGVELRASLATSGVVLGDAFRLRQLFSVLLDNATKFAPSGSVVELVAEETPARLRVTVVDRGPGIAAGELSHIFERFYRGQAERKREGSGLGLSIAQWIAEEHGGKISVRSAPGEGAEFCVELPLEPVWEEPVRRPSEAPASETAS